MNIQNRELIQDALNAIQKNPYGYHRETDVGFLFLGSFQGRGYQRLG